MMQFIPSNGGRIPLSSTPRRSLGAYASSSLFAAGIGVVCACSGSSGGNIAVPGNDAGSSVDGTVDAPEETGPQSEGGGGSESSSPPTDGAGEAATGDGAAPLVCPNSRPQLTDAQATSDTVLQYLAQYGIVSSGLLTDNWDPTAGAGDVSTFIPTFTVAATGGTQTTVQAAIDAAVAQGGTNRIYILVSPGTYREVDCVPAGAPPITLYSTNADPTQTVIVFDNYNGETKAAGVAANACTPNSTATTFGTAGSATFTSFAAGFEAKNITFSNDVTPTVLAATTGTQAVALMTQADKVILDNVRVLGHQDTLYTETPSLGTVVRAYIKGSTITGDVDFIFGGATLVLDTCQIQFVNDRRATGDILSPDTGNLNANGFLVINSTFTADANTTAGAVGLGRAWDRSCVDVPTYLSTCVASGNYPNGQAVVRQSMLGAHIAASPWEAAATTKRGFCDTAWACAGADASACPGNRLYEYENTGPGSAP
jgi:pectinesterase